jgi:hypothetical protein
MLTGKSWCTWRKTAPVPICPVQFPHRMASDWTRASAVGGGNYPPELWRDHIVTALFPVLMEFSIQCLHPHVQRTYLSRNFEKRGRMRKSVQYSVCELTVVSRAVATCYGMLLADTLNLVNHDPRQWRHQAGRTTSAIDETWPPLLLFGNMLGLYKYFISN